MSKTHPPVNRHVIRLADPLLDWQRQQIVHMEQSISRYFDQYILARDIKSTEAQKEFSNYRAHSGIIFYLKHYKDEFNFPKSAITWGKGNASQNAERIRNGLPPIVKALRRPGAKGDFFRSDFSENITKGKQNKWEIDLCMHFEVTKLRPLRKTLQKYNDINSEIRYLPPCPSEEPDPYLEELLGLL